MRRRVFLLSLSGLSGCFSPGAARRLNVYNWSAYVAPETIPGFEKEFGARVRYAIYESNEELLAKVMTGNSGWDVVFPSNYLIAPMRAERLLAPLDHSRLGNVEHLEARFRRPEWDPGLEHSVPYMWGASGIIHDSRVQPAPTAWADLWSSRYQGRLTMLDDPAEVLGACLLKLRLPLNSVEPEHLERARGEGIAQKRLLRAYLNAEVRDQLVAGDVLAAQLWATTSQQAMDAAPHLAFVYPSEGFACYADNMVILRESRRQELAHEFLNYLLRPAVAARIAETMRTATANRTAIGMLPEALRRNAVLYPEEQTLGRGQWFEPLSREGQRLRDRIWTETKAA